MTCRHAFPCYRFRAIVAIAHSWYQTSEGDARHLVNRPHLLMGDGRTSIVDAGKVEE